MICAAMRYWLAWARWLLREWDVALSGGAPASDKEPDTPARISNVDPYLDERDILRDTEELLRAARRA